MYIYGKWRTRILMADLIRERARRMRRDDCAQHAREISRMLDHMPLRIRNARITCKVLLRAAGGALISIIIEIIICAHARTPTPGIRRSHDVL